MPATMSLLGLYNWDSSILEGLTVPEGIDKSALINNLLRECAEFEVLYPQPEALKFFVGEWAKERLSVWGKLAATLRYDYDPISNYDRREEWTDEDSEEREEQSSGHISGSSSGNSSGESSTMTAGFNSADSTVPDGRNESSEATSTESSAESSGETQSSGRRTATRRGRAYGNIGVTTTQQMIEQERNISLFDIDHVIIDDFKRTFCLLIY